MGSNHNPGKEPDRTGGKTSGINGNDSERDSGRAAGAGNERSGKGNVWKDD